MAMKRSIILLVFLSVLSYVYSEKIDVGLSGNAYVVANRKGAQITDNGLENWHDPNSVISVYFYLHEPATANLSLLAKGNSKIRIGHNENNYNIGLNSDEFKLIPVGPINISHPGYVKIDLQGLTKPGDEFGEVKSLVIDNINGKSNYVKDFSDYWGRRGPSVHLAYPLPEGDTEWFYNEVTVPEEGEVLQSYYMADGFGEGYFGMQYNSPHERRILFSVWSPFDTQNPEEIPDSLKVKLLRKGKDVVINEFGGEGSGGQSFLRYPWKAGETYKFLMRVRPDNQGNTIYTAYFNAPEENEWRLIASFLRPQTSTWYTHPYSFLENFNPDQGFLARNVYFGNQWARSKEGKWTRIHDAKFTHDATARAGVRRDYQGGVTDDNRFYLKMGGFFDESVPFGTQFSIRPEGSEPVIDFNALEKL